MARLQGLQGVQKQPLLAQSVKDEASREIGRTDCTNEEDSREGEREKFIRVCPDWVSI